jgi:hypothetical protein
MEAKMLLHEMLKNVKNSRYIKAITKTKDGRFKEGDEVAVFSNLSSTDLHGAKGTIVDLTVGGYANVRVNGRVVHVKQDELVQLNRTKDTSEVGEYKGFRLYDRNEEDLYTAKNSKGVSLNAYNLEDLKKQIDGQAKDSKTKDENGYVCLYKGERKEIYANSTYEAQQKAAKEFGAKNSYEVAVKLAEKNGEPVVHKAVDEKTKDDYGDNRDNKKIEIFVNGKYEATTTWAKTCQEAKQKYLEKNKDVDPSSVKCSFADSKTKDAAQTFESWKQSCRLIDNNVQFEGNESNCKTIPDIGKWDGSKGSVIVGATKDAMSQKDMEEEIQMLEHDLATSEGKEAEGYKYRIKKLKEMMESTKDSKTKDETPDWIVKQNLKRDIANLRSRIVNATESKSIGANINSAEVEGWIKERKALEEKLKSMS